MKLSGSQYLDLINIWGQSHSRWPQNEGLLVKATKMAAALPVIDTQSYMNLHDSRVNMLLLAIILHRLASVDFV